MPLHSDSAFHPVTRLLGILLAVACLLAGADVASAVEPNHATQMKAGTELFETTIAPALKDKCVYCHGGDDVTSDLDMATRAGLLKGGTQGPAIVPGDHKNSLLYKMVSHAVEPSMPPDEDPLPSELQTAIAKWIDMGAPYAEPLVENPRELEDRSVVTDEDRKYWAFQPLQESEEKKASVDFFVRQKLESANLKRSPQADRRTLIVRAYLDLTGLPPSYAEVEAFVADESPDAWPKLIDGLLASPHYGERWARHWLDVARYADSGGYENDNDRLHAWTYRDFVIKALNSNMPYDQFVKWQLAGDELAPEDSLAWQATGFLACGVKNGQLTEREGEPERYDVLDDWVNTTGNAFLGLSLGCARCHDHKFDPVPAKDYYAMASVFATATRRLENVRLPMNDEQQKKLKQHKAELNTARQELAEYESKLVAAVEPSEGLPRAAINSTWLYLKPEKFWPTGDPSTENKVEMHRSRIRMEEVAPYTYRATHINGGLNAYEFRYRTKLPGLRGLAIEFLPDMDYPLGGLGMNQLGRFTMPRGSMKVTPWKDGKPGKSQHLMFTQADATSKLKEVQRLFVERKGGQLTFDGDVTQPQAIFLGWDELPPADEWEFSFQIRCGHESPGGRPGLGKVRLKFLAGDQPRPLLQPAVDGEVLTEVITSPEPSAAAIAEWNKAEDTTWLELAEKVKDLEDHLPPIPFTTSLVITEGKTPSHWKTQSIDYWEEVYYLRRGSVNNKEEIAKPSFLQVVSRDEAFRFEDWKTENKNPLTSGRRAALANWITDTKRGGGVLASRVMVNRLWQHHFSDGIVGTPNDFGVQGMKPTHPELLDWLASRFVESGWDIKQMHRLIMQSEAYQQSSANNLQAAEVDPSNQLLWRYPPHRLEGEVIRDRMLAVSGLLDKKMAGPGTLDERMRRRSIYFTVKRSRLIPSLVQLNWPDTLASLDKRPVTTVAPQALLMMNNQHVRRYAEAFADRVLKSDRDPVKLAYEIAFGRPATDAEYAVAAKYLMPMVDETSENSEVNRDRLVSFCQALLSLNEFSYLQ